MKRMKSINEWFDFRSKEKKEGDVIIESIIRGIEKEKPKINIRELNYESYGRYDAVGSIYTFTLDKLVGFEDDSIVVKSFTDINDMEGDSYISEIIIAGHKIEFSDKYFKKLINKLEDMSATPDTKNDVLSRINHY